MKIMSPQPKAVRQAQEKTKKNQLKQVLRRTAKPLGGKIGQASTTPSLELFQKEGCPSSHAVRGKLTRLGLDYIAHNVPDGNALKHEQLLRTSGRDTIPFLIDRRSGTRLHGHTPIISYLEREYGSIPPGRLGQAARELDDRIRARADQLEWAIRTPIEKARFIVDDISDGWKTMQRSYRVVRKVVGAPLSEKELKKAA